MAHVLILATDHDPQTAITQQWAQDLQQDLRHAGHTSTLLLGVQVTQANMTAELNNSQPRTDVIAFFGHGDPDTLWAQPTGWMFVQQRVLVDAANVAVLQSRPVYAVCCHALRQLGAACGSSQPSIDFVGYSVPFSFTHVHASRFRDVVNPSAVDFAGNPTSSTLVGSLQAAWKMLADQFLDPGSPLSSTRDAFLAGTAASTNALWVGRQP